MIIGQFFRFVLVGLVGVLIDAVSYDLCRGVFEISMPLAKGIGFVFGTVFSYFANTFWTFKRRRLRLSELFRFMSLYAVTLCLNVGVNSLVYQQFSLTVLAFLVATTVSTVVNFIGQKYWVYR